MRRRSSRPAGRTRSTQWIVGGPDGTRNGGSCAWLVGEPCCKLQPGTGENSKPRSTSPPSTSPDLASLGVKSTPSERQVLRADMLDPAEVCWLNGFARKDWKYFFRLASGAQGWQREDAEQEAGEGFPAPRLVPFLGRRCGRRGESVWHSKGPLRLMLVRIPSKHVLTGSSDGKYPSRGWGAMHDALRREIHRPPFGRSETAG